MDSEDKKTIQEKLQQQKKQLMESYTKELEKPKDEMAKNAFRIKAIAHLFAIGFTRKQVAEQLGIPNARVGIILKSESVRKEIERIQEELFFKNPQKMFMAEMPKAFRQVKKMLHGKQTKDAVRLQAANTIFDRALGKPTQEIKHEGGGIRQLIEMIDKQSYAKKDAIDAEFVEVKEDKTKEEDSLDQWLDKNL